MTGNIMISRLYRTCQFGEWSGWRDLNSRHPAPKAGALPDCATPRKILNNRPLIRPCSGWIYCILIVLIDFSTGGAERGNRTPTRLLSPDFESGASTNFTTSAKRDCILINNLTIERRHRPTLPPGNPAVP